MKKLYLTRILKVLALFVPIAAMVLFLQSTLFYRDDDNNVRIRGFYREPPFSLDVVALGASDMYNGFAPGYAYDYCGLTSYLYTCAGNSGALYLPQLKEVLAHQNPQLLLVEVHGFLFGNEEDFYYETVLRRFAESISMSANKVSAILSYEYDDPLSCFLPFFKYHNQWLEDGDVLLDHYRHARQQPAPSRLKGYGTSSVISSMQPAYDVTENDDTLPLLPDAEKDLVAFLEHCRDQGLDNVVFLRFPHRLMSQFAYEWYLRANRVEEIVTSYGFDYLDLEQNIADTGIDYEYDFFGADHLNFYGQTKMTEYLCDIMLDEYGLEPMPQTPENQQRWNESVSYTYALQEYADAIAEMGSDDYLYETPELLRELEKRIEL